MRGGPEETKQLFSYVDIEERISQDHPLRAVRDWLNKFSRGCHGSLQSSTRTRAAPPYRLSIC